jgi:hypothetical protein
LAVVLSARGLTGDCKTERGGLVEVSGTGGMFADCSGAGPDDAGAALAALAELAGVLNAGAALAALAELAGVLNAESP